MPNLSQWWLKHRDRLSFGTITLIFTGKFLVALGIGAILASCLRPWAWWLIGLGVALDLLAKWRWLS